MPSPTTLTTLGGSIGGLGRLGPFVGDTGLYFAVFDAWALSSSAGFPMFYIAKSTDSGATWTDVTGTMPSPASNLPAFANEPGGQANLGGQVPVRFLNGIIYCIAPTGHTGSGGPSPVPFKVYRFNTVGGADAWLTNLADGPFPDDTGGNAWGWNFSIRSDGVIDLIYDGGSQNIAGQNYDRVYWSRLSGGVWSAPVQLPSQVGVTSWFVGTDAFVDSTNRVHFVINEIQNGHALPFNVWHVAISAAGVLQTMQKIVTDGTAWMTEASTPVTGPGTAYTNSSSVEKLAIPYVDGGGTGTGSPQFGPINSNKLVRATAADVPTWGAPELVDSTTQIAGDTETTEALVCVQANGSDLYYIWCTPTSLYSAPPPPGGTLPTAEVLTGDVKYAIDSGSGFGSPQTFATFGLTSQGYESAAGLSPAFIGGQLVMGVFKVIVDLTYGTDFVSTYGPAGPPPASGAHYNPLIHLFYGGSLSLACPLTNTGQIGTPYSASLIVSGGTAPFTFALVSGSLPPGLTLNTTTGVISGTPTVPGTYTYTVSVVGS